MTISCRPRANLAFFSRSFLFFKLLLSDNELSSGLDALAAADLQSLVRLDLSGNQITDISVLEPLVNLHVVFFSNT